LDGNTARLTAADSAADFLPDLVPGRVFDGYCRDAASALEGRPAPRPAVPRSCSLAEVFPEPLADVSVRWQRGRSGQGLPAPIGMGTAGPRILDLESDGPHLLVAGTTGSGKSELLRSLTASLALCYPPDRINFLFFDFKGGSGLGPLTGLPHSVGMLTDLNRHELDRSLASLRAEVRRREELLAAVQAPDLAGYRAAAGAGADPLPHLVLIIDEFRMLVDDAPEALSELMRIAAIGRSLGLHLIMATQRPQGALTADIRANVTTSIALRVQSEMESADIINTPAAAGIGVANPGRAFVARGTEEPVEFQAASLAGATDTLTDHGVGICLAADGLRRLPPGTGGQPDSHPPLTPAQAAEPIVRSLVNLWASTGGSEPHRPIAMPLPSAISYPDTTRVAAAELPAGEAASPRESRTPNGLCAGTWPVRLGWVDQPHLQCLSALAWEPTSHGHLAVVGGPDSGTDEAVALVVRQLLEQDVESHLYILDAGAAFSWALTQPRVGAVAGLHELRRAVRILERVTLELSRRLTPAAVALPPPILLVITGWGSWSSAFRAGPLVWAEDLVQDIIRDGTRAQVSVLISGDREVVTARFFAAIPNRAYFPAGSTEESRLAWPRIPDVPRIRGRAVVFGALTARDASVAQFYADSGTAVGQPAGMREAAARPFRVESLPVRVSVSDVLTRAVRPSDAAAHSLAAGGHGDRHRQIAVGLGGDELLPATVRLAPGSVLPVLGGPVSGKSSLIAALAGLNPEVNAWVGPAPGQAVDSYWSGVLAAAGTGRLDKDAVLLVDDADLLSPEASRSLMDLHGRGWTVVMTAAFSPSLIQRAPLAAAARGHGTGILIAPRTVMDGDFFGVRFEVEANPPPGRAVLISGGRAAPVQLAAGP
jgi:S-DNA-T family DNA segregation ATPase FtsK/SpoIIIE